MGYKWYLITSVFDQFAHKYDVVRENYDLPFSRLCHQSFGDFIFAFMVEGSHWVVEDDATIIFINLNLGQKISQRTSVLFSFAQYLTGVVIFCKLKSIFSDRITLVTTYAVSYT